LPGTVAKRCTLSKEKKGSEYTLVDPYALVFYGWATRSGFPIKELSAYTAWQGHMMKRPTVHKSVESEKNVSTS
jgi:glutathione S-transferase